MKILFTIYSPLGVGGAEVSTKILAENLRGLGHEIFFASSGDYSNFKTFRFRRFKSRFLFKLYNSYLTNYFSNLIVENKINIIHAQDRLTSPSAIMAAKKTGIKSVVHFRDYWFCCPKSSCFRMNYKNCDICNFKNLLNCKPRKYFFLNLHKLIYLTKIRKILNKADARITVSNAVKNKLKSAGLRDIKVIHNAREIKDFSSAKPVFRKKYNLTRGDIALLFSGSLFYTKGIDFILPMIKQVIRKKSNVYMFLAGDGPLLNKISSFIFNNQLNKRIFLLGRVNFGDIPNLYASSDIVLLPSLWEEPFSGVILESICAGKPLISSDVGGAKDVKINRFGYLINSLDKMEWYDKIIKLVNNQKLRKKFGNKAKDEFKYYSPIKIAKEVERVYLSIK